MIIKKPSVQIMDDIKPTEILKKIELAGRTCYKSEDKITAESAEKFISSLIRRGHESVLEHASVTVKFIVDRGVSHEIVRHRLASYSQESTRYVNYGKANNITVIEPCYWEPGTPEYGIWLESCLRSETHYMELLESGATPEQARAVLPNSLKTELVMTANMREWRHFLKLRTDKASHPQIRQVADMLLREFKAEIPVLVEGI
jgi:thymidylate synthase (FAD)